MYRNLFTVHLRYGENALVRAKPWLITAGVVALSPLRGGRAEAAQRPPGAQGRAGPDRVHTRSRSPARPRRCAAGCISTQDWRDLTFVHWAVDPAQVAPLLPPGTRPDVHEGRTYVGLVPFRMVGVSLGRGPGIPYFGTFLETNVRLYSVDETGAAGWSSSASTPTGRRRCRRSGPRSARRTAGRGCGSGGPATG